MQRISVWLLGAALGAAVVTGPGDSVAWAKPVLERGAIADAAERALPSVVNISSTRVVETSPAYSDPFFEDFFGEGRRERYGKSLGSGVIVSRQGYVLTNNHVVAKGRDIRVSLSDGRELEAKVIGADPKSDLAVIKLQGRLGDLQPVRFGDSSKLRLGEVVLAIGNPLGVGQTVTMGIVSAKGRADMGIVDYEDFIQTDAAINPGNSGGALVNMDGELVGINTAILSRTGGYQGIGFAIPSDMARPIMKSLIANGRVVRGWLGVSIQDMTAELAQSLGLSQARGVVIADVVRGSPAARAGLHRGDVIIRVGQQTTYRASHLRNAVAGSQVGQTVELELYRAGKLRSTTVTLAEMPERRR